MCPPNLWLVLAYGLMGFLGMGAGTCCNPSSSPSSNLSPDTDLSIRQNPSNISWPDKVFRLITIDSVEDVTGQELVAGENYLALDADYSPVYFQANVSGHVLDLLVPATGSPDHQLIRPPLDTIRLRVICRPDQIYSAPSDDGSRLDVPALMSLLQARMTDLYMGKFVIWEVDTGHISQLSPLGSRMTLEFEILEEDFTTDRDYSNVIIHEHYASSTEADVTTSIVRISVEGFYNDAILLHELGHLFGLCHPWKCCNLCDCYMDHFMYAYASAGISQIMIRDYLVLNDTCVCESGICNLCSRDECTRSDISYLETLVNDIEFDDRNIQLERISLSELQNTFNQTIGQNLPLMNNYKQAFNHYVLKFKLQEKIRMDDTAYGEIQVDARRKLQLHRLIAVLDKFIAQDSTNVRHLRLRSQAQNELKSGR